MSEVKQAVERLLKDARALTLEYIADLLDVFDVPRTFEEGVLRLKSSMIDLDNVLRRKPLMMCLCLLWLDKNWPLMPSTDEEIDAFNCGGSDECAPTLIVAVAMRFCHEDFGGWSALNYAEDRELRVWFTYVFQQWLHYAGVLGRLLDLITAETKDELTLDDSCMTSFLLQGDLDNMILFRRTGKRAPLPLDRDMMDFLKNEKKVPASTILHAFNRSRAYGNHYKQKPDLLEEDVIKECYFVNGLYWSIWDNNAYALEEDIKRRNPLAKPANSIFDAKGRTCAPYYVIAGQKFYGSGLKAGLTSPGLKRKHQDLPLQRKRLKKKHEAVRDILLRAGFSFKKARERGNPILLEKAVARVVSHKFKSKLKEALGCLLENESFWVDDGSDPPDEAEYAFVARLHRVPSGFAVVHDEERTSLQLHRNDFRTSLLVCVRK